MSSCPWNFWMFSFSLCIITQTKYPSSLCENTRALFIYLFVLPLLGPSAWQSNISFMQWVCHLKHGLDLDIKHSINIFTKQLSSASWLPFRLFIATIWSCLFLHRHSHPTEETTSERLSECGAFPLVNFPFQWPMPGILFTQFAFSNKPILSHNHFLLLLLTLVTAQTLELSRSFHEASLIFPTSIFTWAFTICYGLCLHLPSKLHAIMGGGSFYRGSWI